MSLTTYDVTLTVQAAKANAYWEIVWSGMVLEKAKLAYCEAKVVGMSG